MRRTLLVAAGATVGALVLHRLSRAGAFDGLTRQWHEVTGAVRVGMAEREAELRHALGMDTGTLPDGTELTARDARRLVEDPTGARAR